MATLDNVKVLLEIDPSDSSKDSLLNLYIKKVTDFVVNYCNFTDSSEIPTVLNSVIEDIVVIKYRNRGAENLKSEQIGARNTSFLTDLPKEIINQLNSYRRIRVLQ